MLIFHRLETLGRSVCLHRTHTEAHARVQYRIRDRYNGCNTRLRNAAMSKKGALIFSRILRRRWEFSSYRDTHTVAPGYLVCLMRVCRYSKYSTLMTTSRRCPVFSSPQFSVKKFPFKLYVRKIITAVGMHSAE